ncbi:hypothetical protein [Synoicihabitans lomoniglobus]|uniref:Uncharacterized protein n=1 Tax=Synoicihabitans lomoniglobus TaxID=2909285 RepID=A0AAF0I3W7_9BACT|nr:hypothetical protein [Opitutaceae bacterium LMO-M01]WED66404.1 hypothetical protein PXH66_06030 [Opitutaceae bacterium LMO-M01]
MNQAKRKTFLIFPGMTPSFAVFEAYLNEGSGEPVDQNAMKNVREDNAARKPFRFVNNLIRRTRRAVASV